MNKIYKNRERSNIIYIYIYIFISKKIYNNKKQLIKNILYVSHAN